ncbi:MAG: iron export ABC transporter permease subunit FetB [bacterium]
MSEIVDISLWRLSLGLVFVLAVGVMSLVHHLQLERDLLVGTLRTVVQLFALGYVLKFVFRLDNAWLVLAVFCVMTLFAAQIARGRIAERQVSLFWPMFLSMIISYSITSVLVTGVVIGAEPWWKPQYFIPLAGMVIGNSMNAIAVALDRLLGDLRKQRAEVELKLCLGADYREASADVLRSAMRAGMIPSINSMMAVGVVFIPGMMTGQILAGLDPLVAIRYQIVVMLMLVGSTGLGALLAVLLVRRRCFGPGQQLLIRPQSPKRK